MKERVHEGAVGRWPLPPVDDYGQVTVEEWLLEHTSPECDVAVFAHDGGYVRCGFHEVDSPSLGKTHALDTEYE